VKVAIIGAGITGLTCACELERLGVSPDIYEKHNYIGAEEPHVGAFLHVINRPFPDILKLAEKKYKIYLKPVNKIRKITHFSPNYKAVAEGKLGSLFLCGKDHENIKEQLYRNLKSSKIYMDKGVNNISRIAAEYDYVVVATGNPYFAKRLGLWEEWVNGWVKGAVVTGDFDPTEVIMWINKDFAKNGYAYLTPFNKKKGSIMLFVDDTNEKEINTYWKLFLKEANIQYPIVEEFQVKHFSGYAYPYQKDNILFIGMAAGAADPFLGFAFINGFMTAVMAAKAIVERKDYRKLIKPVSRQLESMFEIRKAFNDMDNLQLDNTVKFLSNPLINKLIYNTKINIIDFLSFFLKATRLIFAAKPHRRDRSS
jgi:digeranylgeranylglycerophospholipid reductase